MIRRPPRSTQSRSSAASDVYKRQALTRGGKALTLETSDKGQKASAKKMRGSAEPLTKNAEEKTAIPPAPAMTIEEAFKPDQVACMICGKTGMKTLKRHIASAHDLKPGQYKRRFKIPKDCLLYTSDAADDLL